MADSVKTFLIEITDQGETIKFDGGFTLDDDWNLAPDQTVINEVKRKLRKAGSIDMDFPEVPVKEMANGRYTYQIDRENTVAVRINAEGSLLVEDSNAPAGSHRDPTEHHDGKGKEYGRKINF